MPLVYKCVELMIVSDDTLERVVNEWVGQGWTFERTDFVANPSSRRPVMAFVWFVREPDAAPASEASERQ